MKYTKRLAENETIQKVFNTREEAEKYFKTSDIVQVVGWEEWKKLEKEGMEAENVYVVFEID